jgi:hypothetical protein
MGNFNRLKAAAALSAAALSMAFNPLSASSAEIAAHDKASKNQSNVWQEFHSVVGKCAPSGRRI